MKIIVYKTAIVLMVVWACILASIPAAAEDIEETIKYKAPTMQ